MRNILVVGPGLLTSSSLLSLLATAFPEEHPEIIVISEEDTLPMRGRLAITPFKEDFIISIPKPVPEVSFADLQVMLSPEKCDNLLEKPNGVFSDSYKFLPVPQSGLPRTTCVQNNDSPARAPPSKHPERGAFFIFDLYQKKCIL